MGRCSDYAREPITCAYFPLICFGCISQLASSALGTNVPIGYPSQRSDSVPLERNFEPSASKCKKMESLNEKHMTTFYFPSGNLPTLVKRTHDCQPFSLSAGPESFS